MDKRKIEKTMAKEWLAAGEDETAGRLWHLIKIGVLSVPEALGEAYYEGLCTRSCTGKEKKTDATTALLRTETLPEVVSRKKVIARLRTVCQATQKDWCCHKRGCENCENMTEMLEGALAYQKELRIAGMLCVTPELLTDTIGWERVVGRHLKETLSHGTVLVRMEG